MVVRLMVISGVSISNFTRIKPADTPAVLAPNVIPSTVLAAQAREWLSQVEIKDCGNFSFLSFLRFGGQLPCSK